MRRLLVLGAGTAGTAVANRLRRELDGSWRVTVVDRDDAHHYQPGYLFVPFRTYRAQDLVRSRRRLLSDGIDFVEGEIDSVDPGMHTVRLVDGTQLPYDQLVIATGTHPRPDQTPGLDDPEAAANAIHSFYTLDGAIALRDALDRFEGGKLVVSLVELPLKCPVAPLEFAFLAEAWLRERGLRDVTELTYVTPLSGAFTKPVASDRFGGMFDERGIGLEADFYLERVEVATKTLVSYDEREVPFDLLVAVPVNMGASFVGRSGLGDELDHVRVDPHTFLADGHDDIFALGDAANLPTSKAGSVAHFATDIFVTNFLRHVEGLPMLERFDGHANCFVESGDGKAMLLDFNYDTQPLPGDFPFPGVGPLTLLGESEANHLGKLAFRWIYWHVLLPGRPLPLSTAMPLLGKRFGPPDAPDAPDATAQPMDLEEVAL